MSFVALKKIFFACALLLFCWLACWGIDYTFFDYELNFVWFKQSYTCIMLACFVFFCLSINRYVGYLLFALFFLISAISAYAYTFFGYEISYDGVAALFQTNTREISTFITPVFCILTLGSLLGSVLVMYVLRWLMPVLGKKTRLVMALSFLMLFMGLYYMPEAMLYFRPSLYQRSCSKSHRENHELYITGHYELSASNLRRPFNNIAQLFMFGCDYLLEEREYLPVENMPSHENGADDQLTIIFVVGESVRADHCSFNSYDRPTTKDLQELSTPIIPLPQMYSYGFSTYVSLEGIFGGLFAGEPEYKYTSFVGLMKKHGYKTAFISENTADSFSGKKLYNLVGYAFDDKRALFKPIAEVAEEVLALANGADARNLVVVENGTGHFPYATEDAYRLFQPDRCSHKPGEPDSELKAMNDYDNCIYSVNVFLSKIIRGLENKNAVVVYCSDHGQFMGEDGKWVHGCDGWPTRHVAAFIWFSPQYSERHAEFVQNVKANAGAFHHQGQLYATVLTLGGLQSAVPLQLGDLAQPVSAEQMSQAGVPLHSEPAK